MPESTRPATLTRPALAFSSPAATIRSEDFPEPDGPNRATASPGSTVSETPLRMLTGPAALANVRCTFSSRIAGARVGASCVSSLADARILYSGDSDDAVPHQENSLQSGAFDGARRQRGRRRAQHPHSCAGRQSHLRVWTTQRYGLSRCAGTRA